MHCNTHQGLHLQLLGGVIVVYLRESTGEDCEKEQKDARPHCELLGKRSHPTTTTSCRSLLHSSAERKRVREPCPSTSASKVAQRQVMLMCCNTVAISPNSCWTPSQHLGPPKEPASNIPHASHQAAVGVKRKLCRGAGGRCCAASAGSPPSLCGCSMLEKVGVLRSKHPSATDATSPYALRFRLQET